MRKKTVKEEVQFWHPESGDYYLRLDLMPNLTGKKPDLYRISMVDVPTGEVIMPDFRYLVEDASCFRQDGKFVRFQAWNPVFGQSLLASFVPEEFDGKELLLFLRGESLIYMYNVSVRERFNLNRIAPAERRNGVWRPYITVKKSKLIFALFVSVILLLPSYIILFFAAREGLYQTVLIFSALFFGFLYAFCLIVYKNFNIYNKYEMSVKEHRLVSATMFLVYMGIVCWLMYPIPLVITIIGVAVAMLGGVYALMEGRKCRLDDDRKVYRRGARLRLWGTVAIVFVVLTIIKWILP